MLQMLYAAEHPSTYYIRVTCMVYAYVCMVPSTVYVYVYVLLCACACVCVYIVRSKKKKQSRYCLSIYTIYTYIYNSS